MYVLIYKNSLREWVDNSLHRDGICIKNLTTVTRLFIKFKIKTLSFKMLYTISNEIGNGWQTKRLSYAMVKICV